MIVLDGPDLAEPTTLSGRPAIGSVTAPTLARPGVQPVSRARSLGAAVALVGVLVFVLLSYLGRGPAGTDVRAMQPGQCFVPTETVLDGGRTIPFGTDTACMEGTARVVANVILPTGAFPGAAAFDSVVADYCGGEQNTVVAPTEVSWANGDRSVVCLHLPV